MEIWAVLVWNNFLVFERTQKHGFSKRTSSFLYRKRNHMRPSPIHFLQRKPDIPNRVKAAIDFLYHSSSSLLCVWGGGKQKFSTAIQLNSKEFLEIHNRI